MVAVVYGLHGRLWLFKWGFISPQPPQYSGIVQLMERRAVNADVRGLSPRPRAIGD